VNVGGADAERLLARSGYPWVSKAHSHKGEMSMTKSRNTYKYHYKIGNKIVHSGITDDLDRREQEHQQKWSKGHIKQVGHKTTEDAAREWEKSQEKA